MEIEKYILEKYEKLEKLDLVEIDYLSSIIQNISNEEIKYKFILLVIFSKGSRKLYDKFLQYKNCNDLNEEESLEYIKIYLDYLIDFVTINQLKESISRFLSFPSSRDKLYTLLKKYKEKLKYYDELLEYIDKNLNDILFKLGLLLENKPLNYVEIQNLVSKFCMKTEDDKYYVSNINMSLLKRVIKIFYEFEDNEIKNLKYKFLQRVYSMLSKEQKDLFIKKDIKKGKIILDSKNSSRHSNVTFDDLPFVEGEHIISISNPFYSNIDTAFSISEIFGMYTLNIYITDVPSFLLKNETVMKEAYMKGSSMYINIHGSEIYNMDIIPAFLSHNYLSLNKGYKKNVVKFSFYIGDNGEVYSVNISRNNIVVDSTLSLDEVQDIIDSDIELGKDGIALKQFQTLISKIRNNVFILQEIDVCDANDLLSMINLIINYYVGSKNKFAIYMNNGLYSKEKGSGYAPATEPLKKFVSNINLSFFMQQNGLIILPDSYMKYVIDNIDEIVNHFNQKEMICNFVNKNGEFVNKYVKKG